MSGSLQEKHGKYYVVFSYKDFNGKRKTEWVNTGIPSTRGNKRKADQRMADIISEREERLAKELEKEESANDMLFADYIDLWLEQAKDTVDVITFDGYKSYVVNHIKPYFAKLDLTLHSVKVTDIEKYLDSKTTSGRCDGKKGGLSRRSLELHKAVLSRMFGDAMREPYNLKDNPCRLAKIPKTAARSPKHISFYTAEQCKKLLDVTAGTPLYDMIYITFMYGLRRSELMGLKWSAVDFEQGTVSICHTVVVGEEGVVSKDSTKNRTSNRVYPLLDDIKPILLRLKKEQDNNKKFFGKSYNDTGYIFTREDGAPYYPSYPTTELTKLLKRLNLPHIRWHDLRHSCASMLLDKGWGMKDISDWLGHADIGTTMNIYAHLDMAHKRKMAGGLCGTLTQNF